MPSNKRKDQLAIPIGTGNLLPSTVRRDIVNQIFKVNLTEHQFQARDNGLSAYFNDWYEEQCEAAFSQVSVRTHSGLLEVVAGIQSANQNDDRSVIVDRLRAKTSLPSASNSQILHASLALGARVWLSTSIDSLQHSLTPGQFIKWEDKQCLSDAISDAFVPKAQSTERVKLPKAFTTANLEKIAGIQIRWTSNLSDHLSLKDDDTKVMLFHQVSFLELHIESRCTKLPIDLIDETIRTLSLLIPSSDTRSRKWFKKKQKELHLDTKAGMCGSLSAAERQIDKFHYWRDRLVILKQTFDDAEPRGLLRWWHDDRKKVQWYTFWVAALVLLLTVLFGLIQSVAGLVAAWAAVKAVWKT